MLIAILAPPGHSMGLRLGIVTSSFGFLSQTGNLQYRKIRLSSNQCLSAVASRVVCKSFWGLPTPVPNDSRKFLLSVSHREPKLPPRSRCQAAFQSLKRLTEKADRPCTPPFLGRQYQHLGLWEESHALPDRDVPKKEITFDHSHSQLI